MSTKSIITALINGNWGDITSPKRIPIKDREVANSLVDELWQTTNIITDTSGTDKFWKVLRYKKQGNIVYLDGYITNKYNIAKSSLVIASTPDSVYDCKTSQDVVCSLQTSSGTSVLVSFAEGNIFLIGSLAPNQTIYINSHYQTND